MDASWLSPLSRTEIGVRVSLCDTGLAAWLSIRCTHVSRWNYRPPATGRAMSRRRQAAWVAVHTSPLQGHIIILSPTLAYRCHHAPRDHRALQISQLIALSTRGGPKSVISCPRAMLPAPAASAQSPLQPPPVLQSLRQHGTVEMARVLHVRLCAPCSPRHADHSSPRRTPMTQVVLVGITW